MTQRIDPLKRTELTGPWAGFDQAGVELVTALWWEALCLCTTTAFRSISNSGESTTLPSPIHNRTPNGHNRP